MSSKSGRGNLRIAAMPVNCHSSVLKGKKNVLRMTFTRKIILLKKKVYYMFNPINLDLSFMFTLVPN